MMQEVVVDTNVAVVANGDTVQANWECVRACSQFLERVLKGEFCILLDAQDRILREYRRQLMHPRNKTQKRLGTAFFKWLWDNQAVKNRCRKIVIIPNETRGLRNFPTTRISRNLTLMIENLLLCRVQAEQVQKYSMLLIPTGGGTKMP